MKIHSIKQLALWILYAHLSLILLLSLQYLLNLILEEKISEIVKVILPMSLLYVSAALKVMTNTNAEDVNLPRSSFFAFSRVTICTHYLLIFALLVAGGFNLFPINKVLKSLLLIEAFFGAFTGTMISSLFGLKQSQD